MTKTDERALVPGVDAAARERLARALDVDGVVAALLIGSQARGDAGPLSDVDIAVWAEDRLSSGQRWDLHLDLIGRAAQALGTGEVDVIMLDGAPPLLRHRAIRGGVRVVDRDPRTRLRKEVASVLEYLDTAPLRAMQAQARRRRLAEGRFGRR